MKVGVGEGKAYGDTGEEEEGGDQSPEGEDLERDEEEADEGEGLGGRCCPGIDGGESLDHLLGEVGVGHCR